MPGAYPHSGAGTAFTETLVPRGPTQLTAKKLPARRPRGHRKCELSLQRWGAVIRGVEGEVWGDFTSQVESSLSHGSNLEDGDRALIFVIRGLPVMICSDKAKLHTRKLLVAHSPHCHCLCSAGQIVGSQLCAQEQTVVRLACCSSPWTGSLWEEWASPGKFQAKQKNVECRSSPCLTQVAIPRGLILRYIPQDIAQRPLISPRQVHSQYREF